MPESSFPVRRLGALVKALVRAADQNGAAPLGPFSAYLDIGASDTMLDHALAGRLDLHPAREVVLNVLGREDASFHHTFAVEIALLFPDGQSPWVRVEAVAGAVYATGALAALGRDFLSHFVLTYDGPARRATLRW